MTEISSEYVRGQILYAYPAMPFVSLSICICSKWPKNWAIQSLHGNEYNYPILYQLLNHLKYVFLCIYEGWIFAGSHWSKLDSILLGSNALIFHITSFSLMNYSKPYIYSGAALYNNYKITPNLMHLQWSNICSYFALSIICGNLSSSGLQDLLRMSFECSPICPRRNRRISSHGCTTCCNNW